MFGANKFEKTMKKAQKCIENGEYLRAKELYVKCLAMEPDNVSILNNLSQIYSMLGEKGKAEGYCEILLKECDEILKHETSEKILIFKANAMMTLDMMDGMNETVDEILKINPDNVIALYHKIHYLESNEEYKTALTYIERILKENPWDIVAILSKGRNLVELNDFDNAEACYNLVFEMEPKNKAAINLKSELLKKKNNTTLTSHDLMLKAVESFEMEDFNASKDFYKKALDMSPEYDEIWFAQGELFIRTGHIGKAINSFKKAFEINPRSGGVEKHEEFFKILNRMKKINGILGFED